MTFNFIFIPVLVILQFSLTTGWDFDENSFLNPTGGGKFLYFAYGSNLLEKRILINNPSAEFYSLAVLQDYRLDFALQVKSWRGAVATIVPEKGSVVWGILYIMDIGDIPSLDKQEGVDKGWYYAKNVTVTLPSSGTKVARTYQQTKDPEKLPTNEWPFERKPSNTYMEVIIFGADEHKLPASYIKFLKTFPKNGLKAQKELLDQLGPPFNETSS